MTILRCAFLAFVIVTSVAAKAIDISPNVQRELIDLDRKEDQAYFEWDMAQQEALMGKITKDELEASYRRYEDARAKLQQKLSELPNRPEIEKWLIDQHIELEAN